MTALPEGLTQGTWNLDAAHTTVGFTIRHAGISKVRGTFEPISGSLEVGDSLESLVFAAELDITSVDTNNDGRDDHLRSPDFFDAAQFPEFAFRSTKVESGKVTGDLTLHGVTKEVVLDAEFEGTATDPFGAYRAGFSATTSISRKDFGLTWNAALAAGGVLVGDEVKISVEAEFVAPTAA